MGMIGQSEKENWKTQGVKGKILGIDGGLWNDNNMWFCEN